MRYIVAVALSAGLLAATLFLAPWLRAHGWPSGGLLMIASASLLAIVWTVALKKPRPS